MRFTRELAMAIEIGEQSAETGRWSRAIASLGIPAAVLAFGIVGALLRFTAPGDSAHRLWMLGLVLTGAPVVWRTARAATSAGLSIPDARDVSEWTDDMPA